MTGSPIDEEYSIGTVASLREVDHISRSSGLDCNVRDESSGILRIVTSEEMCDSGISELFSWVVESTRRDSRLEY